jgi:hypothetical protein
VIDYLGQAFASNVQGKGKWEKKKSQGNSEDATMSLKNITFIDLESWVI